MPRTGSRPFLHRKFVVIVVFSVFALIGAKTRAQPAPVSSAAVANLPPADASSPFPKLTAPRWVQMHQSFLRRGREAPIGLLFLGDSITEYWTHAPEVWKQHYWKYMPADFGIDGDRTQNVIWRIENGELDGIQPRVVVLMLGTNNVNANLAMHFTANTAAEIFAADRKIVTMIRSRIPRSKVLLLAIFPRGPRKNSDGTADDGIRAMETIRAVNRGLAGLDDGANVRFLDLGAKFIGPDGKILDSLMPEHLHPNAEGYRVWADAMQPLLDEMMR